MLDKEALSSGLKRKAIMHSNMDLDSEKKTLSRLKDRTTHGVSEADRSSHIARSKDRLKKLQKRTGNMAKMNMPGRKIVTKAAKLFGKLL